LPAAFEQSVLLRLERAELAGTAAMLRVASFRTKPSLETAASGSYDRRTDLGQRPGERREGSAITGTASDTTTGSKDSNF